MLPRVVCLLPVWLAAFTLVGLLWLMPTADAQSAEPFAVIINEWSQGPSGAKEWVELLTTAGPLDLRGWDLGDNSPGDLRLTADLFWSVVPAGALIVIYNAADPDPLLPPADQDWSDLVVILPHNSPLFSGAWPAFANTTVDDNPIVRDAGGLVIHNYSTAPGATAALRPGAGQSAHFTGAAAAAVADPAAWAPRHPAAEASPGVGNTPLNRAWIDALRSGETRVDLALQKSGPVQVESGDRFTYTLTVANGSPFAAPAVVLTDTLPAGLEYVGDTSGVTPEQPAADQLIWQLGELAAGATRSLELVVQVAPGLIDVALNRAVVSTAAAELTLENNTAAHATRIGRVVVIGAVHYDAHALSDEAVQLINLAHQPIDVSGWTLSDAPTGGLTFPPGALLPARSRIWITDSHPHFREQFGFAADYSRADLSGSWPGFANAGDEVLLRDADGRLVDALVYGFGDTTTLGWSGPAVLPYSGGGVLGTGGQILYRKLDQRTGFPVADGDTAVDWAQAPDDPIDGRRVRYPGWDLEALFFTAQITETAVLTLSVAPDNSFAVVKDTIDSARSSLRIQSLVFTNLAINEALIAAADRGVSIDLLLEGSPPGGLLDQERYLCQQLEGAGGRCWFSINEPTQRIYDRYRFMHAKFMLIDGQRVLISTDNFTGSSMPYDDFSDGTSGRRGALLVTDAPGVVARVQEIWSADFDPVNHAEIFRWSPNHPLYGNKYGLPPLGFIPDNLSGGFTYTVRYPAPAVFSGEMAFEVIHAPETTLRTVDGLLGLIGRAGLGDALYVQQLNERPYWGASNSNPTADPNPRLEAYIAAARRGADVWLLLDEYHVVNYFDPGDPPNNARTCAYVNDLARAEGLRLRCRLGLPADLGIHAKIVLAQIGGRGYIHIGSINGTEQSNKGNRELALQVQSDAAFAWLREMFLSDWPNRTYLPLVGVDWRAPADHVLIGEVYYDSPGAGDEAEFIELVNPTGRPIDLSGWSVGDAVLATDFEDMRAFPPGTTIQPLQTLVIAFQATAFRAQFGRAPDFEIWPSDPQVPDLIDDPRLGDPAAWLRLGNQGDEVLLRTPDLAVIDAVVYGSGAFPGVVPAPLLTFGGSLERYPYWLDTDDCSADFRPALIPSPGVLPTRLGAGH